MRNNHILQCVVIPKQFDVCFILSLVPNKSQESPDYTVVTILEPARTPGFLLEVASVLSGLRVELKQGVIQVC